MNEVNPHPSADFIALKQRLAGLSAGQRALLTRRLGGDGSQTVPAEEPPAAFPRARPLRVEEQPRVAVYPASPGQRRMWFLHHYAPDSPVYSSPSAFHLAGLLNVEWLQAAFSAVIQGHDLLRTTFAMDNGELTQRVAASSAFQLQQINLEEMPAETRRAAVEQCLNEEAGRPFDLAAGPLLRAVLVRLQPTEQVLLLVLHHIISDGWSRANFYRELAAAYAALAAGRPLPGRPSAIQFADYSAWQQGWLAEGAAAAQTAYWQTQLAGAPGPLLLPSDHARPAAESFRGGHCSQRLEPGLTAALKTRAQEEGATLFMILLAAFNALLHRYTGQDDLTVGAPVANRPRTEVEGLIGFFVNTLVLRTQVPAGLTFRELLRRVKATAVEAYANQDLPFEQLVEQLPVRRDAGRTPLFQVTFALQDFPAVVLELPGLHATPRQVTTHTAKFDLSLALERSAEGWRAAVEYRTDLFEAGRMERLLDHWRVLLESIVTNPDQRVSEMPLLTAAENHQILVEWNQTERDFPQDKCVHQLFEEQVERTPGAVAVVFEGKSLTYAELNRRANQLAHHLRSLGVGPDVLAGLCVERSLEMVVGLLGILKAGGAYVPLDAALPRQRLEFLLRNSGCAVVLTQTACLARLPPGPPAPETSPGLVTLDSLTLNTGSEAGRNPAPPAASNHLAYVIYTSGSTGQPKGVEMPHRALVNLIHWQCSLSALGPASRTLQFASLGFDVSFQEMFSTWAAGGTLVLVSDELRQDPAALLAALTDWRIERVFLPFVMLEHLAGMAGELAAPPVHLKEVSVAGEQLRLGADIRRFFARLPGCRLWNHYGPAETHVVTSYELTGPAAGWPDLPPIGRPLPNCQIYLLDARRNPVPPGVVGELYIGGQGLSRGYRRRPDLTAERFPTLAFNGRAAARLYRTGDLARWRPDGSVEYLGRADQQVKIRGHRVELGEVEAVLGGHPNVAACAVVVHDRGGGDKMLVAYVVVRPPREPSQASLRQWLGQKLPDYMIPSRFLALPALPLTPNGKVDRKALEKLDGKELAVGTDYVAPRNELEQALVEIWQTVLQRERVGMHDSFFDLGGHSLLTAAMGSRIASRLQVEVSLRRLFEHPTIEALARHMASSGAQAGNLQPIQTADRGQPLPMSFGQQQMWLRQQTLPDPATYNQAVAWHLSGPVDGERVRRALRGIQARHEILRSALLQPGGSLIQQVFKAEEVSLPWREIDLSTWPVAGKQTVLAERLLAEARAVFDLTRAPLWRVAWLTLSPDEHLLACTFHHSIVDEWSLRLFSRELEQFYAADEGDAPAGLPELTVQYADYAAWQRGMLTGDLLAQQRAFWQEQLRDLPPVLELPADQPRPLAPSGRGAVYHFQVTGPVVDGLRERARQEKTTLFTVMLAAFQVWLYRCTGQTDVLVGTPFAHRMRPEVQPLLGYFLNTLPIRTGLDGSLCFQEVVRQVRQTVLAAFDHASLPFEQMVELAVRERTAAQPPLYQVMFVLLEERLPPLRLGPAHSRLRPVETGTSKNDLMLSLQTRDSAWDCELEYATDLFTAERAASLARQLTELLRSITENPGTPIGRLNLLPEAERRQILVEWNQTERDYPRDKCIHEVFEEQMQQTPGAVAVVFEDKALTYTELNARANHLARHLCLLGVGPDVIVGLCVERSLEMVIGLLGILKAGGAYWALDAKLPQDRLRWLLADARPLVLLVRRESFNPLAGLAANPSLDSPTDAFTVAAIEDLLASAPAETPVAAPASQAGNPAYVSYTSGSTGRPKGVVVPHRGVVRLVKGTDYVSLKPAEVLLQLSPLSFDASSFELWGALLNGGRVVLLPPGPPAPAEIGGAIHRHGVTTLWLTAGLFHLMVDEHLDALKPLRQLLAGGDVLSPAQVRKARRALPGCRIINGYGPTENTTFTCCHTIVDEGDLTPSVPIGRPIANTRVYVLDPGLHPVPVGVAGELYAGGDGVACGYLRQPELTAERFLPDPFSGQPGARLYRTGDLVRWRPDGNLEFLGRLDAQVKIRGFRVELGEVEAMLGGHPEVAACAVVVQDRGGGDKALAAYLVGRNKTVPSVEMLRQWLGQKLPDYMLPNSFVWLDQLPLTHHGKVDRKVLPAPEANSGVPPLKGRPPVNLLELELVRLWRRLFQREAIGTQDNFFALGGHSLLAARLAAEIGRLLGRQLPIAILFQTPTIELLARWLADEHWTPPWSSLVPLQPQGSRPPLFFVHGSHGDVFGFLELAGLLGPDQPCYGIQAVGLDGRSPRHVTVEAMAAHYVREIISFQPEGPLHLAGFSMGGIIAFEMSRQLQAAGRRVALLALLDTHPIGVTPWFFYGLAMAAHLPRRGVWHARRLWALPLGEQRRYLQGRWATLRYWMKRNRTQPPPVTAPPPLASQPPQVPGFLDYYHAVGSAYRPRPYPGSAEMFISDDGMAGWKWYWRFLVRGGVSFHRVPGNHTDILLSPDHRPAMAKALSSALQRIQEPARTKKNRVNQPEGGRETRGIFE